MLLKNICIGLALMECLALNTAVAQKARFKPNVQLLQAISNDYKVADEQYKLMAKELEPNQFPKTFYSKTGKFETSTSGWWCSGFYPGTLLYLYQQTKDEALLTEANRMLGVLAPEQYNKTTHDWVL